jgi:non-specific serine/threonine protein kinase/serine/threonine-protein kinase
MPEPAGGQSSLPSARAGVHLTPASQRAARLRPPSSGLGERYRVGDEIGRGGMGAVLEVRDLVLDRSLAMKVALGAEGERGARVLERFLDEAQITGQLDHPGVVPVHELGVDERGRVYFTMRLVRGRTAEAVFAAARARRDGWTLTKAIEVMLKVCDALAFAHSRGVVHRDLKPSNVMVGRFGEVYVMDWGLACVLGTAETAGSVAGTPSYMAPEQGTGAGGIDPRTDVYAAGAMLYELLGGYAPYQPRGASQPAAAVLDQLRAGPPAPLHELDPDAPAELIAVCEKAMARRAADRYASMGEVADDLRAFLERRVVKAYRTGALAEMRMWVRRNKGTAAGLAAAVLVLVGGTVGTATQFLRAERRTKDANDGAAAARAQETLATANAARAEREAAAAREREREVTLVAQFQAAVLDQLDPQAMGLSLVGSLRAEVEKDLARRRLPPASSDATLAAFDDAVKPALGTSAARTLLDEHLLARAVARAREQFVRQPLVEAKLDQTLGVAYFRLGMSERAHPVLARAHELRRGELGPDHRSTLDSLASVADVLRERQQLEVAARSAADALERSRRALGEDDETTIGALIVLGDVRRAEGDFAAAEELFLAARERGLAQLGPDHPRVLGATTSVGLVLDLQGKLEAAAPFYREALENARRALGADDPTTLVALGHLGRLLAKGGRLAEAEPLWRDLLERRRRVLGDAHPDTTMARGDLAFVLRGLGRLEEAEALAREALAQCRSTYGDEHQATLHALNNVGQVLRARGKLVEAEACYRQALDGRRRVLGSDHPDTLISINNLGALLLAQDRPAEAEPLCAEAVEARRRTQGDDHPETLTARHNLAGVYQARGDAAKAEELFRAVLARRRAVLGEDHPRTLNSVAAVGGVLVRQGRLAEAEPLLREGLERAERALGPGDPAARLLAQRLVDLYEARETAEPGQGYGEKAAALRTRK